MIDIPAAGLASAGVAVRDFATLAGPFTRAKNGMDEKFCWK